MRLLAALLCLAIALGAQDKPASTGAAQIVPADPYYLQSGDTIEIKFFFNPELNDTVQIRPDGRISLQLVGEIELSGMTVSQAMAAVETAYRHELKTARVSIQVRGYAGQKIFVTGEVQRPGTITLPGEMSLMAALSDAGGIKVTGNRNKVILIRKGADGNPTMKTVLLRANGQVTAEAYTRLRSWDVVMVPESRITRMDRWVDQYIKQLSPANMSAGFTYLYNTTSVLGVPVP